MTHEEIWNLLAIEPGFRERHAPTVRRRLLSAGKNIKRGRERSASLLHPVDMAAINQCLHLASTVLLLGTDSDRLRKVVTTIKAEPPFTELDATTVVTSVVLFNLLLEMRDKQELILQKLEEELKEPGISPEESQRLSRVRDDERTKRERLGQIGRRFGELNWMINSDAVDKLGLKWTSDKQNIDL